jgi:hypothetical protein
MLVRIAGVRLMRLVLMPATLHVAGHHMVTVESMLMVVVGGRHGPVGMHADAGSGHCQQSHNGDQGQPRHRREAAVFREDPQRVSHVPADIAHGLIRHQLV